MWVILKDDGTDYGTAQGPSGSKLGRQASSRRLSRRVDNGMGNDGTACAGNQAIQLLLITCFLCGWTQRL